MAFVNLLDRFLRYYCHPKQQPRQPARRASKAPWQQLREEAKLKNLRVTPSTTSLPPRPHRQLRDAKRCSALSEGPY